MRKWGCALLCSLLMLLAAAGISCAVAEGENLASDRVELISEGKFPPKDVGVTARGDMAGFDELIISELTNLSNLIDVSVYKLTLEEFRSAYRGLLNAHPELFYVSGGYSYYSSNSLITRIIPNYRYTPEEIPAKIELFNRKLSAIVSYANKASSTVGKLLRASDYICVHYEYDDPATEIYSPEEMFEKGRGICQAYTMVYVAVCNKLGVPNTTAYSEAMNHIWNMVKVGGSWYHVDVTWNDPIADAPYRAMHNNLLRSDAGIRDTGHYSWVASATANNTRFDSYFWQDIEHAVPLVGNTAFFTPNNDSFPDGRICTADVTTGEVKDYLSYDASFYGSYYRNINPLWATSTTIYYGLQDTVYALSMKGGRSVPVFSLNDKSEYLFYFYLSGSTMYVMSTNMNTGRQSAHSFKLDYTAEVDIEKDMIELQVGKPGTQLSFTLISEVEEPELVWSGSSDIITVDKNGMIKPVRPGVATVTLQVGQGKDTCTVVVHSDQIVALPWNITRIDAQAFADSGMVEVLLCDGLISIGDSTFANCTKLKIVNIPASVQYIADNAFAGCENVTLMCVAGSEGEVYAIANGFPYVLY